MIFINQHKGMGDHIVCNGLIRELIKKDQNKQYSLFVKKHNYDSVSFMFRDLDNLQFIVANDAEAENICSKNTNVIAIGFQNLRYDISFESSFYNQCEVPFQKKWESFICNRNIDLERNFFNKFDINEDYIFVHDDERYHINPNTIKENTRIIRPLKHLTSNIFSYCKLINKAKEVHCIESSFAFMTDLMDLNKNTIIHRYARNLPKHEIPLYKNVKEILI